MRKFNISRLVTILALVAVAAWAQAPELKWHGLDNTFLSFGKMKVGYMEVEVEVNHAPFHFKYKGLVNAGSQTSELKILKEDVVVAFSYFDTPLKDKLGRVHQFALDSLILFLDDEPLKMKGGKFDFVHQPWKNKREAKSKLRKSKKFRKTLEGSKSLEDREMDDEDGITTALADPWNREILELETQMENEGAKREEEERLAALEQARQDSLSKVSARAKARAELKRKKREERKKRLAAKKRKARGLAPIQEEPEEDYADESTASREIAGDFKTFSPHRKNTIWTLVGTGAIFGVLAILEQSKAKQAGVDRDAFYATEQAAQAMTNPGVPYDPNASVGYRVMESERLGHLEKRNILGAIALLGFGGSFVLFYF